MDEGTTFSSPRFVMAGIQGPLEMGLHELGVPSSSLH